MVLIKELELKQFLKLFWDKKIFIIMMVVVFAIMGWAKIEFFTTPVYKASGKMLCARSEESINEGATVTSMELAMPSSLSETYAELIKSDMMVGKVIANLGLDMPISSLAGSVDLTALTKVYYTVSVTNTDAEKAAQIANEFMKVFSEEIKNYYEIDNIYVIDEAKIPSVAINMNANQSMKIFAGIGLVVAAGIVLIIYMFNNTVTNSDQIKRYTKLPTLASIPRYSGNEDLITIKESKSPYAESIKILRTNLQYMYDKGPLQTVAVTSSLPGEGKSWLTANLAVAFANSGKKTLIIDADMRRGRQHRLFKVRKIPGLSEYLRQSKESTGMIAVKGKRVAKKGMAKVLGVINRYIKIEKIPAIADIIYKEEYINMVVDDKTRTKALKKETTTKELEIAVEKEKKLTKATKKVAEKEESKESTTKKSTNKKTTNKSTKKEEGVMPKEDAGVEEVKNEKDDLKISNFVNQTGIDNLYVLPAGSETMESSELLSTERLQNALNELKDEYDMILIDTPPVSVVADGFIISRMVDTNIIVLKHGNTEISELNKIKNNIQEIGGEVIGTVINKIPDANKKYYHTYYNKKVN